MSQLSLSALPDYSRSDLEKILFKSLTVRRGSSIINVRELMRVFLIGAAASGILGGFLSLVLTMMNENI